MGFKPTPAEHIGLAVQALTTWPPQQLRFMLQLKVFLFLAPPCHTYYCGNYLGKKRRGGYKIIIIFL